MIKIILVEVGKEPRIEEIEDDCKTMQGIVGGWIQGVGLGNQIMLICNDEGLALGLPQAGCGILGNFFITKYDRLGDSVSLDPEECEMVLAWVVSNRSIKHSGKSDWKITAYDSFEDMRADQENRRFDHEHKN